ncbi:Uncharacterised protein [Vibrio cholerae]|uniref:Uncharacterized protein n=1 Tax=Vibrio cholerae TaxID=666 RepID=A0A655UYY0_VIBCL|nr:Uncharacterised protein [Vibrio cholerae]
MAQRENAYRGQRFCLFHGLTFISLDSSSGLYNEFPYSLVRLMRKYVEEMVASITKC